jgi:ubiquinone/menaquinone biosynthesis C-methylase UbiE
MSLPAYAANVSSFPEMYERFLVGPLFRPFAETLLDRVGVGGGDRVIDVACGTGIVARVARERLDESGRVVGVDLSPQMLEVAGRLAPEIEWRQGSADALPLQADERFDVLVSHQGLQFFADKPAAAREMRRAVAEGGRLGIGVWRAFDDNAFFADTHAVAEQQVGPIVDGRHAYGDPDTLAALLRDAGFRDVQVERVAKTIRFGEPALLVRLNSMALVGMSDAGKQMNAEQKTQAGEKISAATESVVQRYMNRGELVFELTTNVATARG